MKRKLLITAACVACFGLAIYLVVRGGKRMPRGEPEHSTMTVVVDLPKTNTANAAKSPEIKVR